VRRVLVVAPAIYVLTTDSRWRRPTISSRSRHSRRTQPTPPLGMSPRLRRPHRRLDHSNPFEAEDSSNSRVNLPSRSQRPVQKRHNHASTTTRHDADPTRSDREPQTATTQTPQPEFSAPTALRRSSFDTPHVFHARARIPDPQRRRQVHPTHAPRPPRKTTSTGPNTRAGTLLRTRHSF
jgi:hypothetical protein